MCHQSSKLNVATTLFCMMLVWEPTANPYDMVVPTINRSLLLSIFL